MSESMRGESVGEEQGDVSGEFDAFELETGHESEQGHPPLAELPLEWVRAELRWNCRAPYEEAEIVSAVKRYREEPMLHPPSAAREADERYVLVTGFLRFEVMRRLNYEQGWFRVLRGTETERFLWNLGENTARRDLTGYELVERVWMLHTRGVPKERLLRACGFKVRYLNRLLFVRRRAHPELYELFKNDPSLSVSRMARLCGHDADQQMQEYRQSEAWLVRATEAEQGYSESLEEEAPASPDGSGGRRGGGGGGGGRRRRRFPPRDQVGRLLAMHESSRELEPGYRRGVVASLRHLLYGEPLPESLRSDDDE